MKKLLVISMGGTIDKVYFDAKSEYEVGEPVVGSVLKAMKVSYQVEELSVCKKDSLEITDEDRHALKNAIAKADAQRILVTHGTDTMIESACFIEEHLGKELKGQSDKVIVFTGAMQPAIFKETDGLFNIGTAVGVLSSAEPGIYVAMNGRAFLPRNAQKNYETRTFEEIE